jgi:hypothetical protein
MDVTSAVLDIPGSKMIPAVSNLKARITSMIALGISTS